LLANGASGVRPRESDLVTFESGVRGLCEMLAGAIVADGEGVTRVFEVKVSGAVSDADARLAARTITTSNLVKTAIHGADPNWGRILAAAGRSGAKVDQSRATVGLADGGHGLVVVHGGGPLIDRWAERLGLTTTFVRGLRVTDEGTRDLALAVLGGLANGRVVAALLARGVPAVGLTGIDGGILRAERESEDLGLVGRVTLVDSSLLEELLERGRVPIVAPAALARDDGTILTVKRDAAAGAIAASSGRRPMAVVT